MPEVLNNNAQHTPGPWEAGPTIDSSNRFVYRRVFAQGRSASTISVYGRKKNGDPAGRKYKDRFGIERISRSISDEEAQANVRLITAAPRLLAALESLAQGLQWVVDNQPERVQKCDHEALEFAQKVIAEVVDDE